MKYASILHKDENSSGSIVVDGGQLFELVQICNDKIHCLPFVQSHTRVISPHFLFLKQDVSIIHIYKWMHSFPNSNPCLTPGTVS